MAAPLSPAQEQAQKEVVTLNSNPRSVNKETQGEAMHSPNPRGGTTPWQAPAKRSEIQNAHEVQTQRWPIHQQGESLAPHGPRSAQALSPRTCPTTLSFHQSPCPQIKKQTVLQSTSTLSEVVNQAIGTQFPEFNDSTVATAMMLRCLGADFERDGFSSQTTAGAPPPPPERATRRGWQSAWPAVGRSARGTKCCVS